MAKTKVYVAMSGGVDSSVTAALLQRRGYEVTGVYMKNWSKDLPGHICNWETDYQDAKRVAVKLGIDFKLYDFEDQYRQRVVDYMVEAYRLGQTPNPDITCNQEIKFKLFLGQALSDGADLIATGHYSIVVDGQLRRGIDENKDQSYFLYRVNESALKKSLLPLGELKKPAVRLLAHKFGLSTADKKDSQGICFVGKVGIKDFLTNELGPQSPGTVFDQNGNKIGQHDGALFYTIGQRHGLAVGGGLPYYVVGKDMAKNEVRVTTNLDDRKLWGKKVTLTSPHWVNRPPVNSKSYSVRTRHRAPLIPVRRLNEAQGNWCLDLEDEVRAITPGQSAVLYDGDRVVGGGIVI